MSPVMFFGDRRVSGKVFIDRCVSGNVFWR